ncbi:PIG-P [Fimicolochytrium jonesii]|uniref:PIG-P n=1 Tax=Fimicolochytrium jonesii TaxID=1396493 RepID=UPI0022FEC881|nr:PIG-P [Fimicolochytrium jonesii]KAI8816842.1 PIG-P [Fimicolochytrium jonesii]
MASRAHRPALTADAHRRTSEKREYYGFVVYLGSFVAFASYLLWALCSDDLLHAFGVSYYPTRWWALALPVHFLGWIPFILLMFTGINMWRTPALGSLDTVSDTHANHFSVPLDPAKIAKLCGQDSIPEIEDMPISFVNRLLYG